MNFLHNLLSSMKGMFPSLFYWTIPPLIPFIVAEQIWPVHARPKWRDYGMNITIALTSAYLALPLGILAGIWSADVRHYLPWKPASVSFSNIAAIPAVGHPLEIVAMIFGPLFVHDFWFYWAHRIEHKVPVLWSFHKLHHSDELMNTSTWARDHFLQNSWRAFFSIFTLGLFFDLNFSDAGKAALYSFMFLAGLSLFYHSAIRVQLPWLDRVVVTPQVHRIHHSIDPMHYNKNFADGLPIFDIIFGTYHRPTRNEFPATGLGDLYRAPRSIWAAQFGPVMSAVNLLLPEQSEERQPLNSAMERSDENSL
jgi:sterol desaturase/sphingolipid hydroxylase (fatty acid hydroxylase superfamily)